MSFVNNLTPEHWYALTASIVIAFIVGYLYGRRGNQSRPLSRIAKSIAQIEKHLKGST